MAGEGRSIEVGPIMPFTDTLQNWCPSLGLLFITLHTIFALKNIVRLMFLLKTFF